MAIPVITLLITSCLIIMQLVLTAIVIRERRRSKVHIDSDGASVLERAIRAHANFTEVTPIFLISLLILELVDSYLWWVSILGVAFIIGRILHATSLLSEAALTETYPRRMLGMLLTLIPLTASAISGVVWVVWNLI
jgi:uncharacterized membrane protein YecN with MAPEG domain